jgi:signal transduction histidine kinase
VTGSAGRSPVTWLVAGLLLTLATVIGASAYARQQIARLRDEQVTLIERHRLDSLQLIRIQSNLSQVADTLRDMTDGVEPYPLPAWRAPFERLRLDLQLALERERELAPVSRPSTQAAQLDAAVARFWETLDRGFDAADAGREDEARELFALEARARHAELAHLVSSLLVANTQVNEEANERARAVYDAVRRQILWLNIGLVAALTIAGALVIRATRRSIRELQQVSADRRALSWQMIRLQEDVQASLARELHDDFGQLLTATGFGLGRIRRHLERGGRAPEALAQEVGELQALAQQVLDGIRQRSRALHPVVLDDFGLDEAVRSHVEMVRRQHGISIEIETDGDLATVGPEAATHLYRIVQEALTNVVRHAGASEVWITLRATADELAVTVDDDGRGLAHASAAAGDTSRTGLGLTSMRERAALMGGTFALEESPHGGVRVSVRLPRPADAAPGPPGGAAIGAVPLSPGGSGA